MVDDQLELGRLHDRQVDRLGTPEKATGVNAGLTPRFRYAGSVAHQSTDFDMVTPPVGRGNRMACCQLGQLDAPVRQKGAGADKKGVGSLACEGRKSRIDLG